MQTQNIECQIAQAQLRRYLMGDDLPYALVADLETHLKHCPGCMEIARQKRESLKGVLASEITGRKFSQPTVQKTPTKQRENLREAISAGTAAVQSPTDVFSLPDSEFKIEKQKKVKVHSRKTIYYSIGLAVMLVLMSTVFRDPTKLFGPRAATIQKDTPPVEQPVENSAPVVETPTVTPEVTVATEPAPQETTTTTPPVQATQNKLETDGFIVADSIEGTKVVKKDPPPAPKPTVKKASTNSGSTNSIKVYPPDSK